MTEDEQERVIRQGEEAWERLKKGKNLQDWIAVGEGLKIGRAWARQMSGINDPTQLFGALKDEPPGYKGYITTWLKKHPKYEEIDKTHRSRTFKMMDNLPAILPWLDTQGVTKRLSLNHPKSILENWERATRPPPDKREKDEPEKDETEGLRAHIQEIDADREKLEFEIVNLKADLAKKEAYIEQLNLTIDGHIQDTASLKKVGRWGLKRYGKLGEKNKQLKEENRDLRNDASMIVRILTPDQKERLKGQRNALAEVMRLARLKRKP